MAVLDLERRLNERFSLRQRRGLDGAWLLTLYAFVLFALPARLIVAGLGAAGRPAVVIGCGLLLLWAVTRLVPAGQRLAPLALRHAILGFACVYLLVYALGTARGLPPAETNGADRALIGMASLLGVALVACDGIPSWSRLQTLLRRLVAFGTAMALLGCIQFFTGQNIVDRIQIPGLQLNRNLVGIGERGGPGFARVAGTASHSIEFGVVLAMLVPLAIHLLLFARTRRSKWGYGFAVGVLAASVPMSVSRAGTLALILGVALLGLCWVPRVQWRAAAIAVVGVLAFQAVIPGLIGTIRSAFLNYENDPSIQNRRSDYAEVAAYFQDRPWFGRGPGTFTPERYVLLDNQGLMSLLETGVIGTAALLAALLFAIFTARAVRHRAQSEQAAHLGNVLAIMVIQGIVASLTFDSLSFATFSGLLFLVVGLCGALHRVQAEAPSRPQDRRRLRRTLLQRLPGQDGVAHR